VQAGMHYKTNWDHHNSAKHFTHATSQYGRPIYPLKSKQTTNTGYSQFLYSEQLHTLETTNNLLQ